MSTSEFNVPPLEQADEYLSWVEAEVVHNYMHSDGPLEPTQHATTALDHAQLPPSPTTTDLHDGLPEGVGIRSRFQPPRPLRTRSKIIQSTPSPRPRKDVREWLKDRPQAPFSREALRDAAPCSWPHDDHVSVSVWSVALEC